MSVNARWTNCPAYIKAQTTEQGSDEWAYFNNLSYTLSMALVGCRFTCDKEQDESPWAITKDNWADIFVRVSIWEHLWGGLHIGWEDDKKVDVYFTPDEIQSMIGLSVNAGTETDKEFGKRIYREMKRKAQDKLRAYLRNQEEFMEKRHEN